ncbi:MAG: NADPH:quinone reductase [Microbacteriaceae bacterium]|nr:NADPH:quinone reductase [Microbacteriaceae bacterium]
MKTLDGPESARPGELPEPEGAHERARGKRVLIDVHAAGLSFIDALQAQGVYQYATPPPYAPGSEAAGIVREADAGSGFEVGDRVAGITFWGGLAERCLIAPDYSVRLPDAVSFVDGAAVYLNYSTAWYAYYRAGVTEGQTVLLHGAAGGVGSAVLDLAPVFGARVIAVVSSDEKARLAERSGAWAVLRSDEPWLEQARTLTDGHGVDVVLDPVGGDRFTDSLRAMRIGGTLVVIGFAGGSIPEVKVNRLLLRNLTLTGISMDSMDTERPGELVMVRDAVQRLLDDGRIHPVVGERFPFERGTDALVRMAEGSTAGKVVVELAP